VSVRRYCPPIEITFREGAITERMYTGTLIRDLLLAADRVRDALRGQGTRSSSENNSESLPAELRLESEQFTQALGLGAADGNLGLFLIVHPQLVGTFEPGDDFADAVDVHEVGAMSAPK
jgi:hypothetical protein